MMPSVRKGATRGFVVRRRIMSAIEGRLMNVRLGNSQSADAEMKKAE
jgi:hypothetical protein